MLLEKIRALPLIVLAGLCQLAGFIGAYGGALALARWNVGGIEGIWVCVIAGAFAALMGFITKLPLWWLPINLVFPVAIYSTLAADLPSWIFLAGFVILALFYWNSAGDRVPLYLSNTTTWNALSSLVSDRPGPFIDMGCGFAGPLFFLANSYPDRQFVGVESAPFPYLVARLRKLISPLNNVDIVYKDLWQTDLSCYQTVYAFLSPAPMQKLFEKVIQEMPSDSLFISNSFTVPSESATRTMELDDRRKTKLHIWEIKSSKVD